MRWFLAARAADLQDAFAGSHLNDAATAAGYDTTQGDALGKAGSIISVVIGLLGVIFLILTIYGGFLWMTAAGNEKQVEKAKNIISRAAIGVVIVLAAYAVTYFILKLLPR